MEPAEAARMLTDVLARGYLDSEERMPLTKGLSAAMARMEPAEAARVCDRTIRTLLRARSVGPRADWDRPGFDSSVAELLPRLGARQANPLAAILAALMGAEQDAAIAADVFSDEPGERDWPSGPAILSRVLTDTSPMQRAAHSLRMAMPRMGLGIGVWPASAALPAEPWPCRLTTQELVDLLKMPTCLGRARRVVLEHLGQIHGRRFADHWEFVRFAHENHLSLDFTTSPRRPDLAALGADEASTR
jgi:hypothetical protein